MKAKEVSRLITNYKMISDHAKNSPKIVEETLKFHPDAFLLHKLIEQIAEKWPEGDIDDSIIFGMIGTYHLPLLFPPTPEKMKEPLYQKLILPLLKHIIGVEEAFRFIYLPVITEYLTLGPASRAVLLQLPQKAKAAFAQFFLDLADEKIQFLGEKFSILPTKLINHHHRPEGSTGLSDLILGIRTLQKNDLLSEENFNQLLLSTSPLEFSKVMAVEQRPDSSSQAILLKLQAHLLEIQSSSLLSEKEELILEILRSITCANDTHVSQAPSTSTPLSALSTLQKDKPDADPQNSQNP